LHPAELTVYCRLIRFSSHGASCPRETLRFFIVSLPEVQEKRGADVNFLAEWAHVSNQEHQVSPRGTSDWWRESVWKSVSVHQDKIRGSAIDGAPVPSVTHGVVADLDGKLSTNPAVRQPRRDHVYDHQAMAHRQLRARPPGASSGRASPTAPPTPTSTTASTSVMSTNRLMLLLN